MDYVEVLGERGTSSEPPSMQRLDGDETPSRKRQRFSKSEYSRSQSVDGEVGMFETPSEEKYNMVDDDAPSSAHQDTEEATMANSTREFSPSKITLNLRHRSATTILDSLSASPDSPEPKSLSTAIVTTSNSSAASTTGALGDTTLSAYPSRAKSSTSVSATLGADIAADLVDTIDDNDLPDVFEVKDTGDKSSSDQQILYSFPYADGRVVSAGVVQRIVRHIEWGVYSVGSRYVQR
jgi:hypothetical protein